MNFQQNILFIRLGLFGKVAEKGKRKFFEPVIEAPFLLQKKIK
jgi:hypothetical protein